MQRLPYAVLATGVLAVSTASILIRFAQAQGMDELTIAAYRLLFAALLLMPFAVSAGVRALRGFTLRDLLQIVAAGACLAIHFATWISSLAFTSVASSVALVTSHPLWVGLIAYLVFRERPGRATVAGIGLTLIGALTIMWSDQSHGIGPAPLIGNLLATAGAAAIAAYIVLARSMRLAIGTLGYVGIVYAIAAVLLILGAAGCGRLFAGLSGAGLSFVFAMAVVPQLIGHTAINYAARQLRPTMVSVAILAEPILSAAFAWVLFQESVAPLQMLGFALTLCGIVFCALERRCDEAG